MRRFRTMQHAQRLEEVAERFGLALLVEGSVGRILFAALGDVRVGGRALTAAMARARAELAGIDADEAGVLLPLDGTVPIELLEDRLLDLLGGLLEADPDHFLAMPSQGLRIPASGALPESTAWLERLYAGGFVPREKKPLVVDLARCQGPYMRSVDADPLQILDGASQIASLAGGFRPGPVQAALDEGRFDPHLLSARDMRHQDEPDARELTRALLAGAPPGLRHVAFTNSGAEANEKALDIARRHGPGGHRVVAFEGSFHGRTLLSLHATWNPAKRERYHIPGFEAAFVPFPASGGYDVDPAVTRAWREAWSSRGGDRQALAAGGDALLQAEVASLAAAERAFEAGDVLACIVEPFQGEGGDNPATRRFFHGLRALTRAWSVPLIMDEVQAGFGLSGPLFWHSRFLLQDAAGRPDGPDIVTGAKRAQVGVVLSRWPDPRSGQTHSASMVRGLAHLRMVQATPTFEEIVAWRLDRLSEAWPDGVVTRGRVAGDAFAFDLPTAPIANHLMGQRFYQGAMVYTAGERTLRYRLNRGMVADDVHALFEVIQASVALLVEQAGGLEPAETLIERMSACKPPAWVAPQVVPARHSRPELAALLADPTAALADRVLRDSGEVGDDVRAEALDRLGLPADARGPAAMAAVATADAVAFEAALGIPLLHVAADLLGTRIRRIDAAGFDALAHDIEALEADTYEAARRDGLTFLRCIVEAEDAVVLVAEDPDGLVGMAFAGPLELWWHTDGPRQDPNLFRRNTLYSADITVTRRARGRGVGYRLRHAQVAHALAVHAGETPRYAYVTGRNRLGEAAAMWATNRKLGAYSVAVYHDQYGSETGRARYYRLPLRRHDRRCFQAPALQKPVLDLGNGVQAPTGEDHPLLVRARSLGVFDEGALTKLTVSNFVTRPIVRYVEALRALAPRGCTHLYLTSSHDEQVDKAVRVLKHKRGAGRMAVGLRGGWLGQTTAAARSLTDWGPYQQRDGFFGWPLVPHPVVDPAGCIDALDALVERHGADALIGVFVEAVQRQTGLALDQAAWDLLCGWRDRTGVPLVLSETTTGRWRTGHGMWWADGVRGEADAVLWWGGGQIGHVFCNAATFVDTPLTFISTWDGDELSATRSLWQLYACVDAPVEDMATRLEHGLRAAGFPDDEVSGLGLYRVIAPEPQLAEHLWRGLERFNLRLGRGADGALVVCPPITVDAPAIDRLCGTLSVLLREAGA